MNLYLHYNIESGFVHIQVEKMSEFVDILFTV